jgi:hypothetical protein
MTIWTALHCFQEQEKSRAWGIVVVGVFTLLLEIAVASLLGFHCYITCVENMTTFQHNYDQPKMNDVIDKININLWEAPVSAERLRRPEVKALH